MIYPIGGCSTRPIVHVAGADAGADAGAVAGAVADTDETYGAQAAAEKNTFTNTNNSANNANNANNANSNAKKGDCNAKNRTGGTGTGQ